MFTAKHIGKVCIIMEQKPIFLSDKSKQICVTSGSQNGIVYPITRRLAAYGVTVVAIGRNGKSDISNRMTTKEIISTIEKFVSIQGVIHNSNSLYDFPFNEHSWYTFLVSFRSKLLGTWYLNLDINNISVQYFVLFSSIASMFGSKDQTSYASANSFLDTMVTYRQEFG